ncbi:hypothetical protein J1605_008636 [Eschrichtius robustus]|uniref:Uncharacterized protein n=1 Tax=Eschrichtius robustus TaxID=9764 RepID=A0AB34GW33_ESCRO|nr:hypothetical protein J1605_008636 [Eschrichtius robustus]
MQGKAGEPTHRLFRHRLDLEKQQHLSWPRGRSRLSPAASPGSRLGGGGREAPQAQHPERQLGRVEPHLPDAQFPQLDLDNCSLPSFTYAEFSFEVVKNVCKGFPGGAVVEDLPANAGHTGSSPGLGRSHMPRSNWAREPQLLSLRVWSLCSATREAAMVRGPRTAMRSGPRLPQLEKALAQKRRPNTAINK